jgi:hypothetical protein
VAYPFRKALQIEYLFGTHLSRDRVHIPLLRDLNRNLDPIYLEIANEAPFALEQELGKGVMKDGSCFQRNFWLECNDTSIARLGLS